jgi:soluble lytic murein transglycosylase-like protein
VVLGTAILILGPLFAATLSATSGHGRLAGAAAVTTPAPHLAGADDASSVHKLPVGVAYDIPIPTPTPVPTPRPTQRPRPHASVPNVSYAPGSVEAIIAAAANAHGVDPNWMIRTAACESGLRPNAYNPSGPYYGLFQFLESTFRAHGGTDIWSPYQQSDIAASMFASGRSGAWPVCSHR